MSRSGGHGVRVTQAAALAGVVLAAALGVTWGAPPAAAAPGCLRPDDPPDAGWKPYDGTDPTRVRVAYSPWRLIASPCPFPIEYRAVVVERGRIVALRGGRVVWEAPLPASDTTRFEDIVRAVDDPNWMAEVEPGVFLVDTAVVQQDSVMTVAAPAVREIRLTTRPHVFIGGMGSTARFEGVTVTSWDRAAGGPDTEPADGRGFVIYRHQSRLDIVRSRFEYLGSDREQAYGVVWREHTTGHVTGSTFANNYFGAFTYEGESIEFRDSVFRDNHRYGLDPHDHSRNLVIEGNEASGNGTHGIVFSSFVNHSVIRNNYSHDNGQNGIVLHEGSNHNLVENNRVEDNRHDGIVLIGSGDNRVSGNSVRRQEVGIRVNGAGSDRVTVQGNTLEDNGVGLQAFGGANLLVTEDNVYHRTRDVAISLETPQAEVHKDQILGSRVGIDLNGGRTLIQSVRMADVDEGLVARTPARVDLAGVDVRARRIGVRALPGSVIVRAGHVEAPRPFSWQSGGSRSKGTPFGYIGLGALAVAVVLQVVSMARNRGRQAGRAPRHVRNTA